jgi:demethylmenaquinone methyltransferase / 2-methoxy-6-polyprenyl-1,4-benzoquinol methylase
MFDDLVDRYDLLNDLLSFGLDRWWRRRTSRAIRAPAGTRVLDLGCGTGKLGLRLAGRYRVVGVDVSGAMLSRARKMAAGRVALVQGSAFRLPFADASFGGAVSGFVLRNLDDLPTAFSEVARVLRRGAGVAFVDITQPSRPALRRLFDAYFIRAAPGLGALVGKREAYRYLVASLGQLPPSPEVCGMLETVGFDRCATRPLTGGVVTLFSAIRSEGGVRFGRPS